MPRAPFIVTGLVVVAALTRAVALATEPDPFATSAAAVLAVSYLVFGNVTAAGLLVAKGPWARRVGLLITAGSLVLAVVQPLTTAAVVALIPAGLALAALAGPWLTRRWLRLLPSADGPPPTAVAALVALLILPAWIAVARADGLERPDWLLVAAAIVLAAGMVRALPVALWSARILLPAAGIAAGVLDGMPRGPIVAGGAIVAAALAWAPSVGRSVTPLIREPSPSVSVPPELVDPEILAEAGYDDRGRPREQS